MLPDYYYYNNYYNLIKFVKPILVKKLCKILKHILYLWLLIYVLLNLGVTFLVENENGKTMNMSIEKKLFLSLILFQMSTQDKCYFSRTTEK